MHDLDRTYRETNGETFEFEFTGEGEGEWNEVFNENELNELASELLEVSQEEELDQFLGSLIKKVGSAVGTVVRSPIGQALGGVLKTVAKKALPMAGAALGNMVVPGLGGIVGSKLGSMAGGALGLELEGLSQEDREFETAKQFVRIASDAVNSALTKPNGAAGNPQQAAIKAMDQALQRHAPGLISQMAKGSGGAASGRWVRKGNSIVIYGV